MGIGFDCEIIVSSSVMMRNSLIRMSRDMTTLLQSFLIDDLGALKPHKNRV